MSFARQLSFLSGTFLGSLSFLLLALGCGADADSTGKERPPAPVEVAEIEIGRIELRRELSGSLWPSADFYAAPRIAGQVKELKVRVSDTVKKGDVVALLDDGDLVQSVRQAEADLMVAKANLREAEARMEIAGKESERASQLRDRGISSDAQVDTTRAERLSAEAGLAVAEAQIARAEAQLEAAQIDLGETRVRAEWTGGEGDRVVAERMVDEGDAVSSGESMFRVVDLDPLLGVVRVTERDYPSIKRGDSVTLRTDAFTGESFMGKVSRIAPVFSEESRQARVEFEVANPDGRLKPGMFVRASLVLGVREDATIVPDLAIVRRNDENGVFRLGNDRETVYWQPVEIGIREGDRVEIIADDISGEVVTLGQQLVNDGSRVRVTDLEAVGVSR
ncbi:efflux RND transporter periplasmic adaptor subunit [Puniceicoccus vermicola]|uniref:Efflux RND transporter periplasmic adaptor subunit n=1 Tax=Puniceicoccus vermicola TaxID=388746 RepID=A0A7X1B0Z4_9BACT|nr:efflux RND transporter periplasmic adaptor subunit [Puniceicoccus vermicola]MBC2603557.1 efflux RND transporter periplasmic adaptor subunit [Puniceicoccus vermicola]